MKALLIRHGETDNNRQRRLQGTLPVPLNATGRAQAKALAMHLRGGDIDRLYASPIARALETAQIIGEALGMPIQQDSRLREIEFGLFEGLTRAEATLKHPETRRRWDAGDDHYRVPGGESRAEVRSRMLAAWRDITSSAHLQTIALVSHGTSLGILLRALFPDLPYDPIPNCSITTLRRRDGQWRMDGFAKTPHRPD